MTDATTRDAALEILKRLEPALSGVASDVAALKGDVAAIKAEMAGVQNRLSRIEGQLTNMPTALGISLTILLAVIANGVVIGGVVLAVLNYARAS